VAFTAARYAILPPATPRRQGGRTTDGARRVLVALGGGRRRTTAQSIAEAIAAADPRAEIRIAGGFSAPPAGSTRNITWIAPVRGLGTELSMATVAVVGGGVSLYEACAAGVPTVGVPVVRSQMPTVRAFVRHGAAVGMPFNAEERRTAAAVVALLDDPRRREVLQRRAQRLVDGHGATRAAAAVVAFVGRRLS
jgi:spore coat polysaccharide biosynthesis predicted glycosyltransferase SpsG